MVEHPAAGWDAARLERRVDAMREVVVTRAEEARDWYRRKKRSRRIAFRSAGVLLLLAAASVTVLGPIDRAWARVAVTLLGAATTCIVGASQFFRWEKMWGTFHLAELQLDVLLRRWAMDIDRARHLVTEDPGAAAELVRVASEQLLDRAMAIEQSEASEFFSGLELPK